MPTRLVPSKVKIAVYLTQQEKIAAETAAKATGLTVSEWTRTLLVVELKRQRPTDIQDIVNPTVKPFVFD